MHVRCVVVRIWRLDGLTSGREGAPRRGAGEKPEAMLSYLSPDRGVPSADRLRPIRAKVEGVGKERSPRLGYAQAVWAVAHRLCRVAWKILHDKVRYVEQGLHRDPRARAHRARTLARALWQLGYKVELTPPSPCTGRGLSDDFRRSLQCGRRICRGPCLSGRAHADPSPRESASGLRVTGFENAPMDA